MALAQQQQRQYNSNQYAQPTTTPVPILKQLNRHNDDGSYSYGYEAADGSFKIETKHQNGEVYGKYGYVDDTGKVREVEYGASKQRGFEPQGKLFCSKSTCPYLICSCESGYSHFLNWFSHLLRLHLSNRPSSSALFRHRHQRAPIHH